MEVFNGTEKLSIAAWGSEAGLDNGFASGEEFTFGIYDLKLIKPYFQTIQNIVLEKIHTLVMDYLDLLQFHLKLTLKIIIAQMIITK